METENGEIFSRPLEAFPILLNATDKQRQNFEIGKYKDDVRWEELDEDIHINSFFEEKEPEQNPIGELFKKYPQINVSAFSQQIGINRSLMAKYIYGIKTPSTERLKLILQGIRQLGKELSNIEFTH